MDMIDNVWKNEDVVLVDNVAVAREVGIGRRAFENNCGDAEQEGGVDDVGMTGNPTDVIGAEESV